MIRTKEETFNLRMGQYRLSDGDCWEWTGGRLTVRGYGRIFYAGEHGKKIIMPVHRASYEFHKGPIPEGMLVCHACDNKACINPDHLWLGTHDDNNKDRNKKNRQYKKVTEEQIRYIRSFPIMPVHLCSELNISKSTLEKLWYNYRRSENNYVPNYRRNRYIKKKTSIAARIERENEE